MKRSIVAAALVALIAAPALADPLGDVRACMLRFAALKSFQMTMSPKEGKNVVIQVVNPDAMRVNAQGMEMVRIGKTMYMNMPGRGWQKFEGGRGDAAGTEMATKIRQMAADPKGITATDLGMKSVGGESLHAYLMGTKDGEKSIVYVGRDGLPHQITPQNGERTPVIFSKFNGIAPIRAPI